MKTLYQCEFCGAIDADRKKVEACEAEGREAPIVAVGDVVTIKSGYRWFDGDRAWIVNPDVVLGGNKSHGNCFDSCCCYQFYYVVTAIEPDKRDGHKIRYHVRTLAVGQERGWTGSGHRPPRKVADPPTKVVEASLALIGETYEQLL